MNYLIRPAWDGLDRILVHKNGVPVRINTVVEEEAKIIGGSAPHKPASEGFVEVEYRGIYTRRYYASVYDMKWEDMIVLEDK